MANRTQRKTKRVVAIDAVRGFAILCMVMSHGLHWFYIGTSHDVIHFGALSVGDIATPLFFVVAGISLFLSLRSRRRRLQSTEAVRSAHFYRFQQLFLLGVPLAWLWGVLQAQAVALLCMTYVALHYQENASTWLKRNWPFVMFPFFVVLHIGLSGMFQGNALAGELLAGSFPIVALLAFMTFGFMWTHWLETEQLARKSIALGSASMALALLFIAFGDNVLRIGMTPGYIFLGCGLTSLGLGVFHSSIGRRWRVTQWLGWIGSHALYIFLLHYGIIAALAFGFGWHNKLGKGSALVASLLLVVLTLHCVRQYPIDAKTIYRIVDWRRWSVPTWVEAIIGYVPSAQPSTKQISSKEDHSSTSITSLHTLSRLKRNSLYR